MNKQLSSSSLFFISVSVDLQYYEISLTFTAGFVSLCCVGSHVVVFGLSVILCRGILCGCCGYCDCGAYTVVCVACVYARECEGDGNAGVDDEGGVVVMSVGHVGGTRGSDIVSSSTDVLGIGGVGGVCEMCVFGSGRRGRRGVDERIGFERYQSCGNRGIVGRVSVLR